MKQAVDFTARYASAHDCQQIENCDEQMLDNPLT